MEIQVRTQRQDQWAQIVESLGDKWGRGIRYGQGPPRPDDEIAQGLTCGDLWQVVTRLSERLEVVEEAQAAVRQMEEVTIALGAQGGDLQGVEARLVDFKSTLRKDEDDLRRDLQIFAELAKELPE